MMVHNCASPTGFNQRRQEREVYRTPGSQVHALCGISVSDTDIEFMPASMQGTDSRTRLGIDKATFGSHDGIGFKNWYREENRSLDRT